MSDKVRACPLCGGKSGGIKYPYSIHFASQRFDYQCCSTCDSVYVDPLPDDKTFVQMYAKSNYHDCFYAEQDEAGYEVAARQLLQFAQLGAKVLDYGCGFGGFLKALKAFGYKPYGVEFDANAARFSAEHSGCEVVSVANFFGSNKPAMFDVVHLGDVLEHLSNPRETLVQLLGHLNPGGLLFVEGPLEDNPSAVYWAARAFGMLKHMLLPRVIGEGKPTHLFRTGSRQQLDFFRRVTTDLELIHWQIYETGWPYAEGGVIKKMISRVAVFMGGQRICGVTFGNRFIGLYRYNGRQCV
jgi:2-polyprenyl-3-methyl-5-hydroxy-6-metoxy-1,4-benzoquinol methylase